MKTSRLIGTGLALAAALFITTRLAAQGTGFTYQGRLVHGGETANGLYEMSFALYDAVTNGNAVGAPQTIAPVPVSNGLFTVTLDFGASVFTGAARWLEIAVTVFGSDQPVVTLTPRQPVSAAPYAIAAHAASNLLGELPADQISGTIPTASLPTSPSFSGTIAADSFSGNGADLTDVNAATLGGRTSSDFWRTTGNSGTMVGAHFVGTTDRQPLELRVNNRRGLRLEPGSTNTVNMIGGYEGNRVADGVTGATVAGGGGGHFDWANWVQSHFGTVSGGNGHLIEPDANFATIGGGYINVVRSGSPNGTISGGAANTIESGANTATIAGGQANVIRSGTIYSTISGGRANRIDGLPPEGVLAGGTIGGGDSNVINSNSPGATISGGLANYIGNDFAETCQYSTVGGGHNNKVNSGWATISGGVANDIGTNCLSSVIGGGFDNNVTGYSWGAIIAGGAWNKIQGSSGTTIGGGLYNSIEERSDYSVIAGGYSNRIGTNYGANTISGGYKNEILDYACQATVAGGGQNSIGTNSNFGVIGGGFNNRIQDNSAYATIPGGGENSAASYAFAAGYRANANHQGTFVWGDSTGADIASTNANSVTLRASGGYRFFSNDSATTGVFLAPGSGTWSSLSDRNAKENFAPADAREILDKLAALPLASWNYKAQDKSVRHLGPMAQDFHAAFGLGESERAIATVDADGVALAAIQGLNQKLESELKTKEARLQTLEQELAALRKLVAKLEGLANQSPCEDP